MTPPELAPEADLRRRIHGPAVRSIRETKGLRSSDVADALGLSRGFYSRLEAGTRQCSPPTYVALAEHLKVPLDLITYVA